ncbi:MAG: AAA family ATPase [Patescibacteria group bacterium]
MPHLLKRLELNGFKSFAQKTSIEFPTGITAIVGPNGSGKSNVIDAVRWLLGERESKNLRGAKAEDLIFAGTPKRARVGQAQASLYFENENNFFPEEFSEIVVSRQVSRDGDNKFFINKAEVRLKDLIDFFAKARLGTKGLVVISQGNSDVFIQSSPVTRREMLEEMLGLREYQLKKNTAERRLKNTQINIDKVEALMKELAPHLRSLKRQTGRWEKRSSLEQELRESENGFFGSQLRELNEKISGMDKEIATHKNELEILKKERESAENNLKKVEAGQPKERQELTEIKKKTQLLIEKKSELQKELGRLEAQLEMEQSASEEVSVPSAKLLQLVKKIRNELSNAMETSDFRELRKAISSALAEIGAILDSGSVPAAAGDAKKQQDSNLKSKLEELNKKLSELDGEISKHREEESSLEKHQEDFYGEFKKAVSMVEAAKDKIEKWESRNQERLFEKERLHLRLSELERQISQTGRRTSEFESYKVHNVESIEDFNLLERRIFKLRGDLASIGEVDEALIKEARETETRYDFLERESGDLEKARNDLKQMIGELNQKIKTEFKESLDKINKEFDTFFKLMFDGGKAQLKLVRQETKSKQQAINNKQQGKNTDELKEEIAVETANGEEEEEKEPEEGLEISFSLPRKKLSSLETLSGGERSLVGIAALFAMISVSPPPFLVLDEIDAALDARNSRRFSEMLEEFSKKTQFVIVTHNRAVMESADILYGVTLAEDGTSKILSLKLE